MIYDQALVAENGDAGDGVHVLLVQETDELGNIVNVDVVLAEQRMIVRDGYAAVGIFDIEYNRIAADFTPMLDDANPVLAARHESCEVNGADLKIFGDRDCLFGDRPGENARNDNVFVRLKNVARVGLVVHGADGVGQFGRGQVRSLAEVTAGD